MGEGRAYVDAISMKCVRHAVHVKNVPTNARTPVIHSLPGATPAGDAVPEASECSSSHSPQLYPRVVGALPRHASCRNAGTHVRPPEPPRDTAKKKSRTVRLGFGTARQKRVLE